MKEKFLNVCKELGLKIDAQKEYLNLKKLYDDKSRFYHNLVHINDGIEELELVEDLLDDINLVYFAYFYHDAIYDIKTKDNEIQSAKMAYKSAIKGGLNVIEGAKIYELIEATEHKIIPKYNDVKYFIDTDLAILGQSREVFDKYEENIRKEYLLGFEEMTGTKDIKAFEAKFIPGRKAVLEFFLNREKIFQTEYFNSMYERSARMNLKRSIKKLK